MVDSIGIAQLAVAPAPVLSAAPSENTPQLTLPNPAPAAPATVDQVSLSSQATQQPTQPKEPIANYAVLGTTAVTMFEVGGQLYTRYRDEVTNKITYVPQEPPISGSDSANSVPPTINITA